MVWERIKAILMAGAVLVGALGAPAAAGQMEAVFIEDRLVEVYTPTGLAGSQAPLVIVLHGGFSNSGIIQQTLPLFDQADAAGARLAFVNGTQMRGTQDASKLIWNAGTCCTIQNNRGPDDTTYIATVISMMYGLGLATEGDVHAVGYSNGAMMLYRFACERPGMLSAAVFIAGTLNVSECGDIRGLRSLHIHGAADTRVPFEGGASLFGNGTYRPVPDTIDIVQAAGTSVDLRLIMDANHGLRSLNHEMRRQSRTTLPDRIGGFLFGL